MEAETSRIVEIGGVKVEVDLRTAKQIEHFRIGDKCKVLTCEQYRSPKFKVHQGVIVEFADFKTMPTIVVCYLTEGSKPDLEFAYINSESKGCELAVSNNDVLVDKAEIVGRLNREIRTKLAEVGDLRAKRDYFMKRFGVLFGNEEGVADGPAGETEK